MDIKWQVVSTFIKTEEDFNNVRGSKKSNQKEYSFRLAYRAMHLICEQFSIMGGNCLNHRVKY